MRLRLRIASVARETQKLRKKKFEEKLNHVLLGTDQAFGIAFTRERSVDL